MASRAHPAFFAIFALVLAPVGAVVAISALLLFGARPRSVFAPGWAVKDALLTVGIHAPNAVGVISTVVVWWLLLFLAGWAWERRRKRATE